jgi:hypothetical protein
MTYNIEVSFNLLKNANVTEMKNKIINLAIYCNCMRFYEEYDIDEIKSHKVNVVVRFLFSDTYNLIQYIIYLKKINGIYIELIYNEDIDNIIFASYYYRTKKMEKSQQKQYIQNREKRERSYSEDEMKILDIIKPLYY